MTGEAAHTLFTAKVGTIEGVHHNDHLPSPLYRRSWDGEGRPVRTDSIVMTTGAVIPQRRGKHPHRIHEFVDGNSSKNLDILEDLFRHARFLYLPSLAAG